MWKHTAGPHTLLHWLPRSSKIAVTGNSILHRQSVITELALCPVLFVHLLLEQNASKERRLTIHTHTHTTKSSPMKPQKEEELSPSLSVPLCLQSSCGFVWERILRVHIPRGCHGSEMFVYLSFDFCVFSFYNHSLSFICPCKWCDFTSVMIEMVRVSKSKAPNITMSTGGSETSFYVRDTQKTKNPT